MREKQRSIINMDVISRYRAKYPPKEHEEAVKMLLEGIKHQQTGKHNSTLANKKASNRRPVTRDTCKESSSGYDCDQASISSGDGHQNKYVLPARLAKETSGTLEKNLSECESTSLRKVQSIGTSTASDSMSSCTRSSVSNGELPLQSAGQDMNPRAPIPSRTIAVQCDLKVSTVRQKDFATDGSMQASSISSTRYGFYSYSPETLERKRRLQRSVSSRDVRGIKEGSDEEDMVANINNELSSSSSCLSAASIDQRAHRRQHQPYPYPREEQKRASSDECIHSDLTRKVEYPRVKHIREDTVPRRPKTAMAYSSTYNQDSDRSSEKYDTQTTGMSRAVSHIALATSRRDETRALEESNSENDLRSVNYRKSKSKATRDEKDFENIKSEHELYLKDSTMDRTRDMAPSKPPRPTLVSSSHNEHVRKLDDIQLAKTAQRERYNQTNESRYARDPQLVEKYPATMSRADRTCNEEVESNHINRRERRLIDSPTRLSTRVDMNSLPRKSKNDTYHKYDSSTSDQPILGSMSLMRRTKPIQQYLDNNRANNLTSYEKYKQNLESERLQESHSKTNISTRENQKEQTVDGRSRHGYGRSRPIVSNVGRSTSMRQEVRPEIEQKYIYKTHESKENKRNNRRIVDDVETSSSSSIFASQNPFNDISSRANNVRSCRNREDSEDSESPRTRTWANPASINKPSHLKGYADRSILEYTEKKNHTGRRASRSQSMRNVNEMDQAIRPVANHLSNDYEGRYNTDVKKKLINSYNSSSDESYPSINTRSRFMTSADLDFDSQHRLNESGLPDPSLLQNNHRHNGPSSYLGVTGHYDDEYHADISSLRRPSQITGRALSQQSLTRPTMPFMSSRGRRPRHGGSHTGSDVGGSSMSLMSRLNSRYEYAHTRAPVVMFIPQVTPKTVSSTSLSKPKLSRKRSWLQRRKPE